MLEPNGCWVARAQHHDPSKEDCSLTLRCLHYPPVDNSKIPANYWRAGSHTDFDTLTLLFQVRCCARVVVTRAGCIGTEGSHELRLGCLPALHSAKVARLVSVLLLNARPTDATLRTPQREGQGGLEVCPGREASTDFGVGNDWTPVVPRNDAITINIGDLLMRWCGLCHCCSTVAHKRYQPAPNAVNCSSVWTRSCCGCCGYVPCHNATLYRMASLCCDCCRPL